MSTYCTANPNLGGFYDQTLRFVGPPPSNVDIIGASASSPTPTSAGSSHSTQHSPSSQIPVVVSAAQQVHLRCHPLTSSPVSHQQELLGQLSPIEAATRPPSTNPNPDASSRFEQEGSNSAPPPKRIYTDDIPVLDPFAGPYGFDLLRPMSEEVSDTAENKPNTACYYFRDEQGWTNLFAKKAPNWWNLSYHCRIQPPENCFLRLVPVYGASDKQQEVIQRCFEDFMSSQCPGTSRYSVIRLGHSQAEYFYDPATERLCVTLPYERPKEGCEYSQFSGKFMCFNSCFNGGQGNKKPLYLIITLERPLHGRNPATDQCEVLGRQCIKFRSCACPKRDKENNGRRQGASETGGASHPGAHSSGLLAPSAKRRRESMKRSGGGIGGGPGGLKMTQLHENSPFLQQHDEHSNGTSAFHEDDLAWPQDPTAHDLATGLSMASEAASAAIAIGGEPYRLVAVPMKLPGALSAILQTRLSLLTTYFMADGLATRRVKEAGPNKTQRSPNPEAQSSLEKQQLQLGKVLAHLNRAEVQAASLFRDDVQRNLHEAGRQHSASTSDSQPNSTLSLNGNLTGLLSGNDSMTTSTVQGGQHSEAMLMQSSQLQAAYPFAINYNGMCFEKPEYQLGGYQASPALNSAGGYLSSHSTAPPNPFPNATSAASYLSNVINTAEVGNQIGLDCVNDSGIASLAQQTSISEELVGMYLERGQHGKLISSVGNICYDQTDGPDRSRISRTDDASGEN